MLGISKAKIDFFVYVLMAVMTCHSFIRSLPLAKLRILTNWWFISMFFWASIAVLHFFSAFLGRKDMINGRLSNWVLGFFLAWVVISILSSLIRNRIASRKLPPSRPNTTPPQP